MQHYQNSFNTAVLTYIVKWCDNKAHIATFYYTSDKKDRNTLASTVRLPNFNLAVDSDSLIFNMLRKPRLD